MPTSRGTANASAGGGDALFAAHARRLTPMLMSAELREPPTKKTNMKTNPKTTTKKTNKKRINKTNKETTKNKR